jgi:dTDP-4-dehydrorhamnose reductase
MKIVLIGADGQLGSDLLPWLDKFKLFPLYYPQFDVKDTEAAKSKLTDIRPDIIINTSGYHRVDECEDNPEEAFHMNAHAVRNLSFICRQLNSTLVHFSTDYVFDGEKKSPYIESDLPNPLSVYGVSKLAGEYFVRNICKRYFLIRTCGLYGLAGCWGKGTNFIDAILSGAGKGKPLRIVNDQTVTPTSTEELSYVISKLIQTDNFGIYHLTNEGKCTWFEFAQEILDITGNVTELIPVTSKEYGAKAVRPNYSVLENHKAKGIGLDLFSNWKKALRNFLGKKAVLTNRADLK